MINEERLERMTIDMLRDDLNYNYIGGENIDRPYDEVLLTETLTFSLIKINPNLDKNIIIDAVNIVKNLNENNLILNNQIFFKYLLNGISIPKRNNHGEEYEIVHLIDFNNVNNNDFLVTNQFTIEEHSIKRPDVIIFINGIPLVVMELKSPFREDATLEDAYKQLKGYMNVHIPSLFTYNQILVVSDGVVGKAGTITSLYTRFTEWKKTSIDDEISRINSHESLIYGLLNKETLLDIIKDYILYIDDNKILPAYHQYYGVEKAINKTLHTKDGKAGLIWHTQGSGKSFTMVFYVGNMIEKLNNPTIIVVTDRNDLDNQLFETFLKCESYLKQKAVQTSSRQDLITKLEGIKAGGIFFTTLQKFNEDTGLLSDRDNILVIVDEAHRSHYGIEAIVKFDVSSQKAYKKYGTAKHLREGFPNAIYLGFTGTPIETRDRSTSNIFGDIIDVYDMTQSIEDGFTVLLHYESRISKVKLNDNILKTIDNYYQFLEEENIDLNKIRESQNKMATVKQIIENPDRLRLIVEDILTHYEDRKNLVANKVMVVAYSRRSAYMMYKLFLELKPEYKKNINMIITPSNSDPEEMQKAIGSKKDKQELEIEFKNPESIFKIAIVVDMWLTGFDVPSLGTMYIDKPMKSHNLMQAIARVNRVFKDKPGGLIIDYIGLKKWLLEALKTYTERDQIKVIDNTELLKTLNDKKELIRNLFHGFKYNHFMELNNREKYQLINDGANYILETEDIKKRFMKHTQDLKSLYTIISGILSKETKEEILYFISIRSFLSKMSGGVIDVKEINETVARILEESIEEDGLILLGKLSKKESLNLLNEEMLAKLIKMKSKNIAADILSRSIKEAISQMGATNLILMQKFSEKFKKIAESYNNRTANSDIEQIIEAMIKLKKEMDKEISAGNKYNLTTEEKAFFDALGNDSEIKELMKDKTLVKIAKELVEIINKNMPIDWDIREDARAKMRYEIKLLLIKYNYPPVKRKIAVETVIKQAELKCRNMLNK